MRRVDDQFAAAFDDAPELVTRLSSHPEFIVVIIEDGDDALVASAGVANVHLLADLGGAADRLTQVAGKQGPRLQAAGVPRGDGGQRDHWSGYECRSGFDQAPGRSLDPADDAFDRRKRTEPVGQVRQFRPRDTGEEVLRTAG